MHYPTLFALCLVASVTASDIWSDGHRPHHGAHRMRKRCKSKQQVISSGTTTSSSNVTSSGSGDSSAGTGSSGTTSVAGNTTTSSGSDSSASFGTSGVLSKNCNQFNFYPDEESATQIDQLTNKKVAAFGYYAHIQGKQYVKGDSSTYFTGSELTGNIGAMKSTGAIFVASVMPVYGWGGLTTGDNTQAMQVVSVLKQFTDEGIEVWLRFAHEMNWYQTPDSDDAQSGAQFYSGGPSDVVEAWQVMAAAIKSNLPQVKMFWSPNIGQASAYAEYWPGSGIVDIIGVDYYPQSDYGNLASHVQDIHDTYAKANNLPFYLGETGTTSGDSTKIQWVNTLTSTETCSALSNFKGVFWFNYVKGGDFRVVASGGGGITSEFLQAMD